MKKDENHHLIKRKDTWYLQVKVHNKRIRISLKTTNNEEARKRRDKHLREIHFSGDVQRPRKQTEKPLFGEFAKEWVLIVQQGLKFSTLDDYRSSMNKFLLPHFGNIPIDEISYLEIRKFISRFHCSAKRINNILVPMRSVFKMAYEAGIIERNPMDRIRNLKTTKSDIHPLSVEEVKLFLESVHPLFQNFFTVAFFTGMRFGEMAALKWENVDFRLGIIKVRETRVKGLEGRPKTKRSYRDINILSPVVGALRDQMKSTVGRSPYVFLNKEGQPVKPNTTNQYIWKPALKKAGLEPRSLYQTRHTFATMMLDGESILVGFKK